jgi:hypothetical protein
VSIASQGLFTAARSAPDGKELSGMARATVSCRASLPFLVIAFAASTSAVLAAGDDPPAAVLPVFWADKDPINVCTAETVPSKQTQVPY